MDKLCNLASRKIHRLVKMFLSRNESSGMAKIDDFVKKTNQMIINAANAINTFGDKLVGKLIKTVPYGDWPGGLAVVTEIQPDANAPDIVFQVKSKKHGEIGVFDHEDIEIIG